MAEIIAAISETRTNADTSAHGTSVAVYDSHSEAESAIRTLAQSGFDMRAPAMGRDYATEVVARVSLKSAWSVRNADGMIGLGRMGASMARRLMHAGHECVVYDVSADAVAPLVKDDAHGASSLDDFAAALKKLRVAGMMVPTAVTEQTVTDLSDRFERGDVLDDGGDSYDVGDIPSRPTAADAGGRWCADDRPRRDSEHTPGHEHEMNSVTTGALPLVVAGVLGLACGDSSYSRDMHEAKPGPSAPARWAAGRQGQP
ncbi:MAG: NAD(P)-binding domain-containing protein [Vicinamibacterales bacterium]